MKGGESMKRYWEYMKEYQEKTKNTKAGDRIAIPEIWIGFKFLDDNGIDKPWQPEEKEKLKKVLNRLHKEYLPSENYSVAEIFCCGYAPYYWEAIKIRYPEYTVEDEQT